MRAIWERLTVGEPVDGPSGARVGSPALARRGVGANDTGGLAPEHPSSTRSPRSAGPLRPPPRARRRRLSSARNPRSAACGLLERLDDRDDVVGVPFDLHLRPDVRDLAVRIYEERLALRRHAKDFTRAVCIDDLLAGSGISGNVRPNLSMKRFWTSGLSALTPTTRAPSDSSFARCCWKSFASCVQPGVFERGKK